MVDFFRALPLLESFEFSYLGNVVTYGKFDIEPSRTHRLRCVALPKLRSFMVDACFPTAFRMFSYLDIQPKAKLHLLAPPYDTLFMPQFTEAEMRMLFTLGMDSLRAHFAGYVDQEGRFESLELYGNKIASPDKFCLDLPDLSTSQIRDAAAATYLSTPFFADVTTLRISDEVVGFTLQDISRCKKVERLCLTGKFGVP